MRELMQKLANILRVIFGYGIMICLFVGGFTFFGYLVALFFGGEIAEAICTFIYKTIFPIIIRASTVFVIVGLVVMYLCGEKALTAEGDRKKRTAHRSK